MTAQPAERADSAPQTALAARPHLTVVRPASGAPLRQPGHQSIQQANPLMNLTPITRADAERRGMVNLADLAEAYGVDRVTIRRALLRPGAPIAVGRTVEMYRNGTLPLYFTAEISRFFSSLDGPDGVLGGRRRSAPVRRVGLGPTPSAGKTYRWRSGDRDPVVPRLPRSQTPPIR